MKKKKKLNYSFLFLFLICISTLFMCIGYASINSITSEIVGSLTASPQDGVIITDVVYNDNETSNGDVANSKINNFYKAMLDSTISLPSGDSYMTYDITVYNNTEYLYAYDGTEFGDDFYSNSNITFEVTGISSGDRISSNTEKTFSITFSYVDKNNISETVLNSYINFLFKRVYDVTYTNIVDDNLRKDAIESKKFEVNLIYVNANYIEVKMNDKVLTLGSGYTYNTSNRILTISEVTGDIEIKYTYTPIVNLYNNSLTPVTYNGERWKIADPNSTWYNYDNQHWANAVILTENERGVKEAGDSLSVSTSDPEALAMFVWIPRFEYKIEGTYGTHSDGTAGTATLPGEIKVNFLPKEQDIASTGYRIHPAFTFGGVVQEGIWVSKFETTGSQSQPTSLPYRESLRLRPLSTQYTTAQVFNTYLNNSNFDIHMTKNSEWGVVAFLSQSRYGKYGNTMYSGANKEIYQNKSSITGQSNGMPASGTTNTQCDYNDITDRGNGTGSCGGGASTTGNIYGAYDMVGNVSEYVMSNFNGGLASSGFSSMPAAKYYDSYTSSNGNLSCNGMLCYGHAVEETAGWYSDGAFFRDNPDEPFLYRGGANGSAVTVGIFYYSESTGDDSLNRCFRVAITSNS